MTRFHSPISTVQTLVANDVISALLQQPFTGYFGIIFFTVEGRGGMLSMIETVYGLNHRECGALE